MVFLTWTTQLLLVLLFSTCEMLVIRHQPLWPHSQATFMPSNENLDESTGTFPTILTPFAKAANGQSTDSAEHPTFVSPTDRGANNRAARPVVQSTFAPVDDDKSTDSIAQPSSVPSGNGPARPVVQSTKAPTDDITKMNVYRTSASFVDRADDKATDSPAETSDVPSGNAAARPVVQSTSAPVDDNDDVTKTNVVRTFAPSLKNAEDKSTDSPAQPSSVPIGDAVLRPVVQSTSAPVDDNDDVTKTNVVRTFAPSLKNAEDKSTDSPAQPSSVPIGDAVLRPVVQSTSAPVDDNDDVTKTNVVRTFAPSLKNAEDKSTDSPAQPSALPIGDGTEGKSTESAGSITVQPIIDGVEDRSSNDAAHQTSAPNVNGVGDDHTHLPTQGSNNIGSNPHPATGYPVNGKVSEESAEPKAAPIGHGTDNDSTQQIDDDHTHAPIGSNSHDDSTGSAEAHTREPIIDYLEDKSSDAADQPSSPPDADEHNTHKAAPTYVPIGYGVDKNTDEPATEDPIENINNNDNHPATGHPPMFSRSM